METVVYVLKMSDIPDAWDEYDLPIVVRDLEGTKYGFIFTDGDGVGGDNLREVLSLYIDDDETIDEIANSIEDICVTIIESP